jgi:hypothetical protein
MFAGNDIGHDDVLAALGVTDGGAAQRAADDDRQRRNSAAAVLEK